ncbi:MAG: sugar phosphate isomerase/epimerase family protein [Verrucomicrobiia bacterium]
MNRSVLDRLAVCSWSLQPASPQVLINQVKEIGLARIQIALDPIRDQPAVWGNFAAQASAAGLELVSGMFGCVGEDYTTLESIRKTGGIVPDANWDQNWANIRKTADLASRIGLKLVTFHAGFLPHDPKDADYAKLRQRLLQVAELFAERGIDLALETGQETADTLRAFLEDLHRNNVGVNFDPANMILYDKGDPITALRTLSPWLKQCHIKDAKKTKQPGTWGEEVVVGTGEVAWREFFEVLEQRGFKGYCAIEREAGTQRAQDIKAARTFIQSLVG